MIRLDRRVRRLEARASPNHETSGGRCEVWIELKDGGMCGADGRVISRSEFEQRDSGASAVVVLPDNERDDLLSILDRAARSSRRPHRSSPERSFLSSSSVTNRASVEAPGERRRVK
jgi:hypothetical protein